MTREFTALGSKVVESNVPFKGPEDEKDFWEGDRFDGEQLALCAAVDVLLITACRSSASQPQRLGLSGNQPV